MQIGRNGKKQYMYKKLWGVFILHGNTVDREVGMGKTAKKQVEIGESGNKKVHGYTVDKEAVLGGNSE
jgi:hypothetical protein